MLSIDLPSDAELDRARFKIYVHTTSNSFQTVRQCMTLGGRRQDEVTLKGLEILRSIWHLLLQEKEEVADDYEHPIHDPSALAAKLFFCLDITPGQDLPEVKLHMPVFGYVKSEEEALQNFEKILHTCNQRWAEGGKYRDMFETTLYVLPCCWPGVVMTMLTLFSHCSGDLKEERSVFVHNYMSFQYRETGVYQTIYMSVPSPVE
jgi:dimethylallyldiphosphate transferase